MNILFVCQANQQRSPTFEKWFKEHTPHNVESAGILFGSEIELSEEQLTWADKVYVMDIRQEMEIAENFTKYVSKVEVIGVSDEYPRESPQLIRLIEYRAEKERLL